MESFKEISLFLTKSDKDRFKETIPSRNEVSMTVGISWFLFSLIRLEMALLHIITSTAGMNPPFILGTSLWETTPKREPANWKRIWFCCSEGKTSIILLIVWAAELVWRVAKTRWPVSAAVIAVAIV